MSILRRGVGGEVGGGGGGEKGVGGECGRGPMALPVGAKKCCAPSLCSQGDTAYLFCVPRGLLCSCLSVACAIIHILYLCTQRNIPMHLFFVLSGVDLQSLLFCALFGLQAFFAYKCLWGLLSCLVYMLAGISDISFLCLWGSLTFLVCACGDC